MSVSYNKTTTTGAIIPPNMILLFLVCMILSSQSMAQKDTPSDSIANNKQNIAADSLTQMHSPKIAARRSAMLPGLGQAYNKKYWKIPVIYAALGTSSWFIVKNNRQYKKYRDAYIARTDNDSTTVTSIRYTTENIRLRRNYYHRNLELSIIITAGIYLFNIVDASVDAHLFYFDVSDDLSMRIQPEVNGFRPGHPSGGLRLSLYF
ncbi:MAG: DUF5683 domain-containing protein [Bacteroidales bacterium]